MNHDVAPVTSVRGTKPQREGGALEAQNGMRYYKTK